MKLSIVTPLYYSAPYIEEFHNRITVTVRKITDDYEIIYVNDGSPDNSLDVALSIYEKDRHVKIVDLSRNFGHHKAILTGLSYAKGDMVFLIDCDLEEEPELLERFYREIKNSDADVIYGVQDIRKGKVFEKITGYVFYKLFNLLSSHPIHPNLIIARLMTKRYVKNLVRHKDKEVFLAGLWEITGFKQIPIVVKKYSRGTSSYNLRKKISIFVNSITSFTSKPLILIFYSGCIILSFSTIAAFYLIIKRLFFGVFFSGWPSLIISIWLLGGFTIFSLGIIGIYLSKIFSETKQRPYTIIKELYGFTRMQEI